MNERTSEAVETLDLEFGDHPEYRQALTEERLTSQAERAIYEARKSMALMTSWHREGRQEGITQGKETLVIRLLRRRFGSVSADVMMRLDGLSSEQLDDLG